MKNKKRDYRRSISLLPNFCPHCMKAVSNPISGIESLVKVPVHVKGKGVKRGERWIFSKSTLGKFLGVSRERGRQIVAIWNKHRIIEPLVNGHGVYRISPFGYIVRRLWIRAGYPFKLKGQRKIRTKMSSKKWEAK